MKQMFFATLVGLAAFAACTKSESQEQAASVLTAPPSTGLMCSAKQITDCTESAGGLPCFTRCNLQPSDKFCDMEALDKCLDNKGGNGCYKKHCDGSVHSGPFNPANGSGLMKLPSEGYGYQTFDVEYMRYGQPKTIARIKELAVRVFNKTGLKLFVGDISNSSGGNSGRHAGHYDGVEVDIAIMGNTPTVSCFTIWESCYARPAQITLINEILNMGGSTGMLLNDGNVQARFNGFVGSANGHDNHLHVNWPR
ncbi:hypothetical protein EBU99_13290 [bacterium]|nr:hypothetical protein [bacterium]